MKILKRIYRFFFPLETKGGNGMINLNKLAKRITLREGKKRQVNIAQVKEILSITLDELSKEKFSEVLKLLEKKQRR